MPATGLQPLAQPPADVIRAGEVIAGLDACLVNSVGRMGPAQEQALDRLGRAFAGTPLAQCLVDALDAIRRNEFTDRPFAVLAAARSALEAARHDALRQQVNELLGRKTPPDPQPTAPATPKTEASESTGPCAAVRHWLMELAIAGFGQLDAAAVAPFSATLDHLLADPARGRLASLLAGFHHELLLAMPIASAAAVPVRRWADLWSRAIVTSLQEERADSRAAATSSVSGRLTPLGVDARQHGTFVGDIVYALLERQHAPLAIVRIALNAYKVDALQGADVWKTLGSDANKPLLQAISEQTPLEIKAMPLLATGDLLWNGQAKAAGKAVDLAAVAAEYLASSASGAAKAAFPTTPPAERHPVQLAELVWLDGVKVSSGGDNGSWKVETADGGALPLAMHRVIAGRGLSMDDIRAASAMLGLLRFDGDTWQLQPLATRPAGKGAKLAWVGSTAWETITAKPKKGQPDAMKVLKERASRLLRQKA